MNSAFQLTWSCPPIIPRDRMPSCMPGPRPTSRSRWSDLSSWTCLVNCVRGFPAVEHSAPPRNDMMYCELCTALGLRNVNLRCRKKAPSHMKEREPRMFPDVGFGSLTNALSGSRGSPRVTWIYTVDLSYNTVHFIPKVLDGNDPPSDSPSSPTLSLSLPVPVPGVLQVLDSDHSPQPSHPPSCARQSEPATACHTAPGF